MKIFVTGASGFIGRHILPLLIQDGHELLILSRGSLSKASNKTNVHTIVGDLNHLSHMKEDVVSFCPQVCLHLAWEGLPDYSYRLSKLNLDLSMNLIEFLVKETTCRKILVGGSAWEYGKSQGACHEDDQVPVTSYFTWAKHALYTGGSLLCNEQNIDFIWFRIFFAFGPGQKSQALIPTLYRAFKNGQDPDIKTPSKAQDFIYVGDVAEAFRVAVRTPLESGIYNIGRETAETVSTICDMVTKYMLKQPIEKKHATLNAVSSALTDNWADTSKFRSATGWRPQVTLATGIAHHIQFMETL